MNVMNDEIVLQDIAISGSRTPSSPSEREQYYRLMNEGYLRRIPVDASPGDTSDPLICELTERGRKRIAVRHSDNTLSFARKT
jgi:hypothetical protein